MKSIFLSYTLSNSTPAYGNKGLLEINEISSIMNGDSCNKSELHIESHIGTHIDAPYHFDQQGMSLEKYQADFWVCNNPFLIHYPAKPEEIIQINFEKELASMPDDTDILLIKTNFSRYRNISPTKYIFNGPGITPDLGYYLRENSNIKMIGFDFISLSSYANRQLGRQAHKAFLARLDIDNDSLDPILIIEDMNLSLLQTTPLKIIISPIRFDFSDGSPATVIAMLE
jgi:kynurenine formamidase